ncbi:hypothetical protein DITRI_Ditri16bG0047700 [Diplodiscus trichospermus]
MSHRKDHSLGNIPFSWEDKPGLSKSSKVTHFDEGLYTLNQELPPSDSDIPSTEILVQHQKVPPPPPCSIQLPPKRSTSVKSLKSWRWQEDPFLAAYKVCTKSGGNDKLSSEGMKSGCSKFLVRKKKIRFFSCKKSSDVRDNNLLKLSNSDPPLPKDRKFLVDKFLSNHKKIGESLNFH